MSALPETDQPQPDDPYMKASMKSDADVPSAKREKHELSSLVRSLKTKTKQIQQPSNGKKITKKQLKKPKADATYEANDQGLSSTVQSVKKKRKAV